MEAKEEKERIREWIERDGGCPLTDEQMKSAVDETWKYLSCRLTAGRSIGMMCKDLRVYRNVYEYTVCQKDREWWRNITMCDITANYRVVRFNGGFVLLQPNPDLGIYSGLEDGTRPWYADPVDVADSGLLMASTLIDLLKKAVEKHGDMPVAVPNIMEEGFVMAGYAGYECAMYDPKEYDSVEDFLDAEGVETTFNGKPYIGPCFTIGEL